MSEIILSLKTDNVKIQSGKIHRKPRSLAELQTISFGNFGMAAFSCDYFLVLDEKCINTLPLSPTTDFDRIYQTISKAEKIHFLMISLCHSEKINTDLAPICKFFIFLQSLELIRYPNLEKFFFGLKIRVFANLNFFFFSRI
jgi:hypothetical protein